MRRECKMVYTYDELDDIAKEKARAWYSELVFNDSTDWEYAFEEADLMASLMGIEIDRRSGGRTFSRRSPEEPCIWFSGFSSQGDGACFEGTYRYKKGAVAAIKAETNDVELIRIAKDLQAVQRKHFYKLRATCKHTGHYSHSGCMSVDVEHSEDQYRDLGDAEDDVRQLMRDFADWIYECLEAEYDYQTSDENVEETIVANAYEFYQSGERV